MLLVVNASSERPIYEQLADSVRRAIGAGDLRVGDRLPAASEVALSLDVNKHTVLHAYQLLRDEGLVDLRRGRGAVITQAGAALNELAQEAMALVERAAALGIAPDTLAALIVQTSTRKESRP